MRSKPHAILFALAVTGTAAPCVVLAQEQEEQVEPTEQAGKPVAQEALTQEKAVELLDDEDYATRLQAEGFLLQDETIDQKTLRNWLLASKSEEKRYRLLRIAEHHVIRQSREDKFAGLRLTPGNTAAVGFSYDDLPASENPFVNREAVMVMATMPGFPAFAYLRPGDIILAVDGRDLSNRPLHLPITEWLSRSISVHQPGDELQFGIVRDGKAISLTLTCAQGIALDQMYKTDTLKAASRAEPFNRIWDDARAKLVADLPQPKRLAPSE